LRILSKPNALACVPAIIFSRRHAAVSPPFGPWRFNFLVPNWFHLLGVNSRTRGSARLARRTCPPNRRYPGGCRSSTLGLLKGRRIQRTNEVLDTCSSIRPLVAACAHARSVFCNLAR
jgi:hypothetical protein